MKISSHNHWDPLEEIIVGTATGARMANIDISTRSMVYTEYSPEQLTGLEGPFPQALVDEANEDLEVMSDTLKSLGVIVHRPKDINQDAEFGTPDWKTSGYHTWCPRDLLLPLGNIMIETPSCMRARYFETRAYHNIMLDAIKDGCAWVSAPKPILPDESYTFEDLSKPTLRDLEPVFDAPNCVRLGKDILFQISNTGNKWGMKWLQNFLEPLGYRIHMAEHIYSFGHFDSTIIPLNDHTVLLNSTRVNPNNCPKIFEKWDKIYFDDVVEIPVSKWCPGGIATTSRFIGMNVLSVDPKTIMIGKEQLPLIKMLESKGFDVIPLPMRHASTLSGGFHCTTLDLRRRGKLLDYS